MRPLPAKAWTLRLKRGRRTVVLFADPSAPLLRVKERLLEALRAAPPRTDDDNDDGATPEPLPASAADVELARPVDVFDVTAGFEMVGAPSPAAIGKGSAEVGEGEAARNGGEENEGGDSDEEKREEQEEDSDGRANARGRRSTAGQTAEDNKSLTNLGIKENAVLVYRFRGGEAEKEKRGKDPGWSIEVPSFEDAYGVENEGDLGVKPEFRG
jgi:hypothetical protein